MYSLIPPPSHSSPCFSRLFLVACMETQRWHTPICGRNLGCDCITGTWSPLSVVRTQGKNCWYQLVSVCMLDVRDRYPVSPLLSHLLHLMSLYVVIHPSPPSPLPLSFSFSFAPLTSHLHSSRITSHSSSSWLLSFPLSHMITVSWCHCLFPSPFTALPLIIHPTSLSSYCYPTPLSSELHITSSYHKWSEAFYCSWPLQELNGTSLEAGRHLSDVSTWIPWK